MKRAQSCAPRLVAQAPIGAGVLVAGIGLLGVLRHVEALSRFFALVPSWQGMKLNTALCLIALAAGLIAARIDSGKRWVSPRAALAAFPILIAVATLAEYVFAVDLKIDQLLVKDIVEGYPVPGRMGFNTAVCFVLLGSALLCIEAERAQAYAQLLAFTAGAAALFVLVGHAFGLQGTMRIALIGLMSMPSAIGLLLLSSGVLCLPTTAGVVRKLALPVRAILMGSAVLMLLLAATAGGYFYLATSAQRAAEQAFSIESAPVSASLASAFDRATRTLLSVRGLFAASDAVTREDWLEFMDAQETAATPGVMGVDFSRWIGSGQLAAHEREIRDQGLPDYHVWPRGSRDAYTPIVYLAPAGSVNSRVLGYDMYSEPTRREAMERAMRTGIPAISGPVRLLRNELGEAHSGFLIYVPIYQRDGNEPRKILGFACSPVRLADFVDAAVAYVRRTDPRIGFELSDAAAPQVVLYRFPAQSGVSSSPVYESRTVLPIAQRKWVVHFYSLPQFERAYQSLGPTAALYAGTLLSLALVLLGFLLLGYRTQAKALMLRTQELGYQLALNRGITEHMADPVLAMDLNGCVTFANAAAEKQLGLSREEVYGRSLQSTIHERRPSTASAAAEECAVMRALKGEVLLNYETVYLRKNGEPMDVLVSATPLQIGGKRTGAVVVAHDITVRKLAEEALLRSNEELQRFAYVASHDLQTPLRSIVSFTQLLEEALRGRVDARESGWMQRIVQGGRKMEQLIAALLQYARVDVAASAPVSVDLNETVRDVLEMLHAAVSGNGATILVESLPTVEGDPTQLAQVFQNLLGNALKYRNEHPVRIEVRAQQHGAEYQLSVSDNGIGIDPKYHESIFEPFKRLHTDRNYQGTGVGLAICRRVIERHGGRLWVESALGKGSTFWFTLPVPASESRALQHNTEGLEAGSYLKQA